ncbi:MAG: hypothetical protein ACLVG5_04885 [Clostridium sp.]
MKRKKERSRATHVAGDSRKRRLHQLFKVCAVLLCPRFIVLQSERIVSCGCGNIKIERTDHLVSAASAESL